MPFTTPTITDTELARIHAELPSGKPRYLRAPSYEPRPQHRGKRGSWMKRRYSLTDKGWGR